MDRDAKQERKSKSKIKIRKDMKIPFDIKFRPQIESGEYRVETQAGCPVRIVCWDMACELPILGLVLINDEKAEEMAVGFTNEGTNLLGEPLYDKLFIVTPEEKLTPLEDRLSTYLKNDFEYFSTKKWDEKKWNETMRIQAAELLSLAKNQLQKEGLVTMAHLNTACEAEYQSGLADGKAEALKNLPRWRKCADVDRFDPYIIKPWIVRFDNDVITDSSITHHGHYLCFADLEKLPKEDGHE